MSSHRPSSSSLIRCEAVVATSPLSPRPMQDSSVKQFLTYKRRWLVVLLYFISSVTNAVLWISFAPISTIAMVSSTQSIICPPGDGDGDGDGHMSDMRNGDGEWDQDQNQDQDGMGLWPWRWLNSVSHMFKVYFSASSAQINYFAVVFMFLYLPGTLLCASITERFGPKTS